MKNLKFKSAALIVALILALSIPLAALAEETSGITISAEENVENSAALDVKVSVAVRTEIADEDVEGASKELSQNVKDVSALFKKYAEGTFEKKWKREETKDGFVSAKGEFRLKTKNISDLSEALIESAAEDISIEVLNIDDAMKAAEAAAVSSAYKKAKVIAAAPFYDSKDNDLALSACEEFDNTSSFAGKIEVDENTGSIESPVVSVRCTFR